jgi:hypothetical protein
MRPSSWAGEVNPLQTRHTHHPCDAHARRLDPWYGTRERNDIVSNGHRCPEAPLRIKHSRPFPRASCCFNARHAHACDQDGSTLATKVFDSGSTASNHVVAICDMHFRQKGCMRGKLHSRSRLQSRFDWSRRTVELRTAAIEKTACANSCVFLGINRGVSIATSMFDNVVFITRPSHRYA